MGIYHHIVDNSNIFHNYYYFAEHTYWHSEFSRSTQLVYATANEPRIRFIHSTSHYHFENMFNVQN